MSVDGGPPAPRGTRISTDIPARLDHLPWSRWHVRVVIALGITWILDGLEVTLVGAVAGVLGERDALGLSDEQIGYAASAYLFGAMAGALFFGRLTDKYGRKRMFLVTLGVYLVATLATAASWSFASFALFRALTGLGIGGECAAMNSAIDELLPARVRGRADVAINGTYWLGTALGAASTLWLLDARLVPHAIGWRLAFGIGAVLGASVILVRRHLPESPRWLLLHGRLAQAEAVVTGIEDQIRAHQKLPDGGPYPERILYVKGTIGYREIAHILFTRHRRRSILGLSLMIAQSFAYNAIFFTYALVLRRFYGVAPDHIGLYLLPFAFGNLLGPLMLGHLFDSVGRRPMITVTYGLSGALLALTAFLFMRGTLSAIGQTALWTLVFFVLSAGASSAYLTVSELFPVELRAVAIAVFYVVSIAAGGLIAPSLLATLIATGRRPLVAIGYLIGAALMAVAAVVASRLGVAAEGKSLEALAEPGKAHGEPEPTPSV